MNIYAFIFAILSVGIFAADFVITKSLLALGLSVFSLAFILTFIASGHLVTL